ncbi:butyryl-CoA dehydrogenase [Catellatospora methionotrophica]|uniref:Dibenzothiophene monooxygenase n=1 Tax=Catellatospora methionotrophica TaxID=121620 RepID=A0A8J3LHE1_9ACTN|nr:acyl-CoA dehydrogenase family protein [Catellatospora methionotrophica]GIG12600.1 butyryl-CoA dehydrogenase [Catellatospora methionotrophica]
MADRLIGQRLVDDMTDAERDRAARVESVLPALRAAAEQADASGQFPAGHVALLREAGLLGLVVPEEYGGLGGGLRDLAAATYAMGSACPSTALAFFFHNTSASRGLLPLEAIEAGLFDDADVPVVRAFAEQVLRRMAGGMWLANFASESVKSASANIAISTTARPATRDGVDGWLVTGEKSFGCATGVADTYLVTARLDGTDTAAGLALFLVPREAEGVASRPAWDGLGMRGSANHGITLHEVWVPATEALTVPGAFVKMLQCSRGSFVGNQLAITAVYVGCAQGVYDETLQRLTSKTFADTGRPIAESPMHQVIIGDMTENLETAYLWLRRQLLLETSEPPIAPKNEVYRQWRLAKGSICENAFAVAVGAFKACGTSGATLHGTMGRALRDLSMGLVMTFPPERGRLEAAGMITADRSNDLFASVPK